MYGGSTDAYPEYPDSVNSGEIYSTAGEMYSNGYGCTNPEDGCLDKSYESSLSEGELLNFVFSTTFHCY